MERSASALCSPQRPEAQRYTQTLLMPPRCLKIALQLHGEDGSTRHCLSIEASDPHTGELLALILDPAVRSADALGLAQRAVDELRAMILAVLDPEFA